MSLRKNILLGWKNPRLAWHKARVTLLNHFSARWYYSRGNGFSGVPQVVSVRLTNLCNMNCVMCGQPKISDKDTPRRFFSDQLSLNELSSLIDQIAPFKPNFYLWGGEPLLYKDIFTVIGYARKKKLTVQINTNGLLIQRYADEIVESGLDDLIVSLDGPEEIHDKIRAMPGAFQQICSGLSTVQKIKKEKKVNRPIVRIRGTIHPDNFESLSDLVRIAQDLNADGLNFNQLWFTSESMGQAYQSILRDVFGIEANSWKGFVWKPADINLAGLESEMCKIQNNQVPFPITVSPYVDKKDLGKYYGDLAYTCGARTCYSIYFKTYIMPNGDVTPCPDFPDFIAGNIRNASLLEIWNGRKYRNFRRLLKSRKLLPICSRCCDLYVSNVRFY
jgi:radical SAM protein with 4Fe4S-binding SPASM domain